MPSLGQCSHLEKESVDGRFLCVSHTLYKIMAIKGRGGIFNFFLHLPIFKHMNCLASIFQRWPIALWFAGGIVHIYMFEYSVSVSLNISTLMFEFITIVIFLRTKLSHPFLGKFFQLIPEYFDPKVTDSSTALWHDKSLQFLPQIRDNFSPKGVLVSFQNEDY